MWALNSIATRPRRLIGTNLAIEFARLRVEHHPRIIVARAVLSRVRISEAPSSSSSAFPPA